MCYLLGHSDTIDSILTNSHVIPKIFNCSSYGRQHKRPVGAKCQMQSLESIDSNVDTGFSNPDDTNTQILSAVSSRLPSIEQQIKRTEEQHQNSTKSGCDSVNLAG